MFLDLTGGEPLLYPRIAEALRYAKGLGFYTSITTNTKLYAEFALELAGQVDFLLFSLDGDREYHDSNRGAGTYDSVMNALETALEIGEKPDLIMTVTGKNAEMIGHVAEVSRANGLILQLNPVFSPGNEKTLGEKELRMMERASRRPGIYLNRAQTELIRSGGNTAGSPRCRAVSSNLVVSTRGEIMLPCYHHAVSFVPASEGLEEAFFSQRRSEYEALQGSFDFCRGCTVNCYFDPSYEFVYDRLCVMSLLSRGKYAMERFLRRPAEDLLNRVRRS